MDLSLHCNLMFVPFFSFALLTLHRIYHSQECMDTKRLSVSRFLKIKLHFYPSWAPGRSDCAGHLQQWATDQDFPLGSQKDPQYPPSIHSHTHTHSDKSVRRMHLCVHACSVCYETFAI